jgi:site-specific DNA recombinase
MTRAAVYTRVSTDDQAREGFSLDEQEYRALQLIAREDDWQHVGTYSDPGHSGADRERPDLRRLLADVAAGNVDVVIVAALDRLSRDAGHLRELLLTFDAAGVRVIASGQALDRDTPEGILQTGILAEFAEFERRKIKARTKAGIASRARNSGKPWGTPAYGFRRTAEGDWEADPVEAAIYRRIFTMRTEQGMAKAAIARQLTREGVPTRHGAMAWSPVVVGRILSGRDGLGEFHHGGEWHRGRHAPLIDEQRWLTAQALDARSHRYSPGAAGRLPRVHLFVRGMLRCSCGEAMLPRSGRDHADFYVCRARSLDAAACPVPRIRRDRIDTAALAMFEEVALDVEATHRHVAEQLDARANEATALAERAAQELAELAAEEDRLDRDYRRGVLPAERYTRLAAAVAEERTAADAEHERLAARAAEALRARLSIDAESVTLQRLAEVRAAIAARVGDGGGDVGALRAALASVCREVRLRAVEDGAIVLDYIPVGDDWRRTGLGLEVAEEPVPADNRSGSGVPE